MAAHSHRKYLGNATGYREPSDRFARADRPYLCAGDSRYGREAVETLTARVVSRADIGVLFEALRDDGYMLVGPQVGESAIVYDELSGVDDLPAGWTEVQDAGTYRLERRPDEALFGYVVGPDSWKKYLFPPRTKLWTSDKSNGEVRYAPAEQPDGKYAFIGARGCELAAIAIQDQVFLESGFTDATYASRRKNLFVVGVNCAVTGGTCFCVSMGTGPTCTSGYDIVLTEVIDGDSHKFLLEAGTDQGEQILSRVPGRPATDSDRKTVSAITEATARQMGRQLDTTNIKELLYENADSAHWDAVAERCLACTNCTLVCPTCFCSTTEEVTDIAGQSGEHIRRWDSCFTLDFSSVHNVPVRDSIRSRYRQWMTHKLASWIDQFGTSGCVGCGRCITWCPVGIDITAEVDAIRTRKGAMS